MTTVARGRFPSIDALAADPARAGVFLDFDGTLAPIATRPEDVVPVPGATDVLVLGWSIDYHASRGR